MLLHKKKNLSRSDPCCIPPTSSYFLRHTSYFLLPTVNLPCWLLNTSCFPLATYYWLLGACQCGLETCCPVYPSVLLIPAFDSPLPPHWSLVATSYFYFLLLVFFFLPSIFYLIFPTCYFLLRTLQLLRNTSCLLCFLNLTCSFCLFSTSQLPPASSWFTLSTRHFLFLPPAQCTCVLHRTHSWLLSTPYLPTYYFLLTFWTVYCLLFLPLSASYFPLAVHYLQHPTSI